ncbi:glycosyltransferase family protein [Actinomadura barringtoniae]|uniref:Glycosyltransferase family protein n=2 Tax=Actinomadura barringtoniae TaxID=1427535 RepID=A0A939PGE6_9ACTN|nr:glycosyltransferase family protein [Actinomadura barringtoniae]
MVGIIQARMGSSRLPGKVLRPLAGRSVLGWVIRAAQESRVLDGLVVATTELDEDDVVVEECRRLGVAWHRGPVDDVLTRFTGALEARPSAEAVMRFTADCPLLDPAVVRTAATTFRAVPGLHYLSTGIPHTLPRGLDVEIITVQALRRIDEVAIGHHRTHVTSYAYTHPRSFSLMGLTFAPSTAHLRVTLDTKEDWDLIEAVVNKFGDVAVPYQELIDWLEINPDVRALNAHVRQKELAEA